MAKRLSLLFALALMAGVQTTRAQVLLSTNTIWRYAKGTNEASIPTNAWRQLAFDDSAWLTGVAPFHYGSGATCAPADETVTTGVTNCAIGGTILSDMRSNYTCIFIRQPFMVENTNAILTLTLGTYMDDGLVVWINGVEMPRQNALLSGELSHTNVARTQQEGVKRSVNLNSFIYALQNGTNVLAIQAFNFHMTNDDFRVDAELTATFRDATGPVVTNRSPAAGATVNTLGQLTVTFDETVASVDAFDLFINGQPANSVSISNGPGATNNHATFTFTQPNPGVVFITWDADSAISDSFGNLFDHNAPSASWSYTLVDTLAPTVVAQTPAAGGTVSGLTQVEVLFSERVSGVDAGDLLVNGVPAVSAIGSEFGPYQFQFSQPPAGPVLFAWAAGHGITDVAPSPNAFAGGSWTNTLAASNVVADVIISEFLAANISGLTDEFGNPEDWIEVHNRGTNVVNLLGWALTDDESDSGKWTFPATNLAVGQRLVVFASELNRKIIGGTNRLHTNFKLNPNGEYLALFNSASPRVAMSVFAPEYPEQRNNHSYGLDSTNALRYFATPTPGSANGVSAISGVLPPVHFSVERGLFHAPFTLLLTCTEPGATVRYTVNGSEPSATNGAVYAGGVGISNSTPVRAAAFKTNLLPSITRTHTYIFPEQVTRQPTNPPGFPSTWGTHTAGFTTANTGLPATVVPADYEMDPEIVTNALYRADITNALRSLPIISIVLKTEEMFDATIGLYTHPLTRGPQWERPCSIEMFFPDGTQGFQSDAGVQIQGNAAREPQKQAKHPMRVTFKGDYGPAKLKAQVFPDSPVAEFDTLILRSDFNFSWMHWSGAQRARGQRTRDAWMKDSMRDMGGLSAHNRYTLLYINGLFWGIYDPTERPDGTFGATYLGGAKEDYDVVNEGAAVDGNMTAYNFMMNSINSLNDINQYNLMKQYLEMTTFIDYMLLHFYAGHEDWGLNKNWYTLRKRDGSLGGFKYIPWDGENILGTDANRNDVTRTDVPTGLHTAAKLLASTQYRSDFADRVHKHFFNGGALMPEAVTNRWKKRASEVELAIIAESARWGDYRRDTHIYQDAPFEFHTKNTHWLVEQNRLLTSYFPVRTANVLTQLRNAGLYPATVAPVFNQHGGRVPAGFALTMTAANTVYFTTNGVDPRAYGTGGTNAAARLYTNQPVIIGATMTVKSRTVTGGTNWSALNEATFTVNELAVPIRITEIMYAPQGGSAFEYIELQNRGPLTLDLGGYSFDGVSFIFPPGTLLTPGGILVIGSGADTNAFRLRYPTLSVAGYFYGSSLNNGGERLALLDPSLRVVTSVTWDNNNGWPVEAATLGRSLEIVDADGDPNAPANWRASPTVNGTPGLTAIPLPPPSVVLNEIMAENGGSVSNGGAFPDWVELRNRGGSPADLSGWTLADESHAFALPPGTTLTNGDYLVIWFDTDTNAPGLHSGFQLGRKGDTVLLTDAAGGRVDGLSFGLQVADFTVGRFGEDWRLALPTPGAANTAASLASATNLVINEWLANAPPGGRDWIELHNRATNAVALPGCWLATSNALFKIESLSFIAPLGYAQLFADELAAADSLDFKLPAGGGAITLYDPTGLQVNRVTYAQQLQNVPQGRLPDGNTSITSFASGGSPEASNYLLTWTGPVLNEIVTHNDTVVSPWGNTPDWVELHNSNAAPFDVSGMSLSDNPADAGEFTFAPGTSIPAFDFLLVWCDDSRAASTNVATGLNTGFALDEKSGGVYLFNGIGQRVDSVEYGFQIEDQSIGRSGGAWNLLAAPTPGATNAAAAALGSTANLRVNEYMADPASGGDWFEIYNLDPLPVAMSGLYLTDTPSTAGITNYQVAPLTFIGARQWVLWEADSDPSQGRHHVNFSLDALGETIRIYSSPTTLIDAVDFGIQTTGVAQGRLPDGATNVVNFPTTASPDAANYLPLADVVINEALAHTDDPREDAIELQNEGATLANISGWYLSNSQSDPKRYRIPDGTFISAGLFRVFYQNQFGVTNGPLPGFTLNSAHGDQVYLSQADAGGNLTGLRASATFGPSLNGVSFGRHRTSVGVDFTALSATTFGADGEPTLAGFRSGIGASNAYPRVGPIVVNEIMYHPSGSNGTENADDEYIELHNVGATATNLFDAAHATNRWRLRGAVSFIFPPGTSLDAGAFLLVVNFDPAAEPAKLSAFRAKYGVAENVPVLGPWSGRLDNGGESVELYQPDTPQGPGHPDEGFVPYVLVDRVNYDDTAPWATNGVDGGGASLQRIAASNYGNDPVNWKGEAPTAGRANVATGTVPPTIVTPPQDQTVILGDAVTFTVIAEGTAPLAYQWQHNGGDIPTGTNDTLFRPAAGPNEAGAYRVRVSNAAGAILSQPATLTVLVPPMIVSVLPASQTVLAGGSAAFTVTATGTLPLHLQWLFNDAPLTDENASPLTINNAQPARAGNYRVVLTNLAGAITSAPVSHPVAVPRTITGQPLRKSVTAG